jgi:hypothetical protein
MLAKTGEIMEVDWYLLEGDLKRGVFSELDKNFADIDFDFSNLERGNPAGKPKKLEESSLKRMKKAELIELLLEKDEALHIEIDTHAAGCYDDLENLIEDCRNAVLGIEENVVNCLKRTFRHMEDNG